MQARWTELPAPNYTAPPTYKETGAPTVIVPPPNPAGGSWQPASPSDGMLREMVGGLPGPAAQSAGRAHCDVEPGPTQALETYLARAIKSRLRAQIFSNASAGPGFEHVKASSNRPLTGATTATSYNDLTLEAQGSWSRISGARPAHGGSRARKCAGQRRDMANVDLSLQAQMATAYFNCAAQIR